MSSREQYENTLKGSQKNSIRTHSRVFTETESPFVRAVQPVRRRRGSLLHYASLLHYFTTPLYYLSDGDVRHVDLARGVKDNDFAVFIAGDVKALCVNVCTQSTFAIYTCILLSRAVQRVCPGVNGYVPLKSRKRTKKSRL
jgi:hypothetical protein